MKLVSFDDFRVGVLDGEVVTDLTDLLPRESTFWPRVRMNWLIEHGQELLGEVSEASGPQLPVSDIRLLSPVPAPGQVYALPANYRAHLGELGSRSVSQGRTAREQGFFLKSTASISGPSDPILLPRASTRRFDHECEVAAIIGRRCRDVPASAAREVVFGYAPLVDMTMRIERGEFEEERTMRKSFESFTPVGPALVTSEEVGPLEAINSRLLVNGEVRQQASLSDMIVGVGEAIELISSVVELRPGDIIATGTPSGVGPVGAGDTVEIEVDRMGRMRLEVRERDDIAPKAY